ncbi:MAG: GNAT family N-acetyltransferase [Lachnospiraceae bacterium]
MRPWCSADAQELYRYAKNPNVGPAAGWAVHGSVEDSLLVIRDILSSPETYAIILKKTGLPIGNIDLMTAERSKLVTNQNECELGFWIGEPYWGQGLVKEAAKELLRHAFEDLKMQTVWCGYYEGNERSMRLQRSLGFVYHSTRENEPVPMLGEVRTEIVNVMQASVYRQKSEHSAG